MATLYNHYAAEYKALAYQAYNIARMRLDQIAHAHRWEKKRAVVVDIDETVLNNTPYEAEALLRDKPYPACWDSWMRLAQARAIPGAVSFLNYAQSQGFEVFYISNRQARYTRQTVANLKEAGFPNANATHVLLRRPKSADNPNPSSKESRREQVRKQGYHIALYMGDNLGDFYETQSTSAKRNRQVEAKRRRFGRRFILLPNAMYGSWARALKTDNSASVKRLLQRMSTQLNAACTR